MQKSLLTGNLDTLLLAVLAAGPAHGYELSRRLTESSRGEFDVPEGSLYPALYRLEHGGLIESEWGVSDNNRKAKYYHLTAGGRKQLRSQTDSFTRYARAVFKVLQVA